MQTKFKISSLILTLSLTILGTLALVGVVSASSTSDLQPASTITYNEELVVNHTGRFNSVYIGKQGTGGVTFFNGTIVNSTTGTGGSNNPVTFGDDVRIDGQIYRTEVGGSNNLKLADSIQPQTNNTYSLGTSALKMKDGYFAGTLTAGTLAASALSGTGIVNSTNLLDATIATADLADSAVTSAKITDGTIASGDIADSAITTGKITDGTIATADLTDSAVTSAKIANGTITGSDIDSTTDISVDSLSTRGVTVGTNINQVLDGFGAIKGLVYFDGSGSCVREFSSENTNIVCTRTGAGVYTIDFGFEVTTRYWQITPVGGATGPIVFRTYGGGSTHELGISTFNYGTGNAEDTDFMFTVY